MNRGNYENSENLSMSDQDDDDIHTQYQDSNKVKLFGISVNKTALTSIQLFVIYLMLLNIGAFIFHKIENPPEHRRFVEGVEIYESEVKEVLKILNNHNYTGVEDDTWELYTKLMEHPKGFHPKPVYQNNWGYSNSIVFSFTIITTIGYGTQNPTTVLGQMFLVVYALIGIPIAGLSFGFFAERVIYIFTWLSKIGQDKIEEAYRHFDKDGSGILELGEFKEAVRMLGIDIAPEDFESFWNEIDCDGGGAIDLEEFRRVVELLNADVTESAGQKHKIIIVAVGIIVWFAFGISVFSLTEGWKFTMSLYFVFVSLTTIGLGDVYPEHESGAVFLVFFAMIGLGLVAVLLTLLQMMFSEINAGKIFSAARRMETNKKRKQLEQIPIFASMSTEDLTWLVDRMNVIEYGPDVSIIEEGAEMETLYILVSGTVTVRKMDSEDEDYESAPSILLESTTLHKRGISQADATVYTNEEVKVFSLPLKDLRTILNKNDMRASKRMSIAEITMQSLWVPKPRRKKGTLKARDVQTEPFEKFWLPMEMHESEKMCHDEKKTEMFSRRYDEETAEAEDDLS